jgi:hypothetical protein
MERSDIYFPELGGLRSRPASRMGKPPAVTRLAPIAGRSWCRTRSRREVGSTWESPDGDLLPAAGGGLRAVVGVRRTVRRLGRLGPMTSIAPPDAAASSTCICMPPMVQ